MTINMRTATKRVVSNCKHKRFKMKTTKIKIMTTEWVTNNYNEKKREGKQQSI